MQKACTPRDVSCACVKLALNDCRLSFFWEGSDILGPESKNGHRAHFLKHYKMLLLLNIMFCIFFFSLAWYYLTNVSFKVYRTIGSIISTGPLGPFFKTIWAHLGLIFCNLMKCFCYTLCSAVLLVLRNNIWTAVLSESFGFLVPLFQKGPWSLFLHKTSCKKVVLHSLNFTLWWLGQFFEILQYVPYPTNHVLCFW